MKAEYANAFAEVNEILKYSDSDVRKKIPYRFRKYLVQNLNKEYEVNIDVTKKLSEQEVQLKTKDILALIYRDYLANQEKREKLIEEEIKLKKENEKRKADQYNYDNLFDKKKSMISNDNNKEILVLKEENKFIRFLKRCKDKIMEIFS